jgi:hypothetical protein
MTVECITCDRFSFKPVDPKLARCGFGACALRPAWEAQSAVYPRECPHHDPAPAEKVEKGRTWLAKNQRNTAGDTGAAA